MEIVCNLTLITEILLKQVLICTVVQVEHSQQQSVLRRPQLILLGYVVPMF